MRADARLKAAEIKAVATNTVPHSEPKIPAVAFSSRLLLLGRIAAALLQPPDVSPNKSLLIRTDRRSKFCPVATLLN
jgi:hypothetical protein